MPVCVHVQTRGCTAQLVLHLREGTLPSAQHDDLRAQRTSASASLSSMAGTALLCCNSQKAQRHSHAEGDSEVLLQVLAAAAYKCFSRCF